MARVWSGQHLKWTSAATSIDRLKQQLTLTSPISRCFSQCNLLMLKVESFSALSDASMDGAFTNCSQLICRLEFSLKCRWKDQLKDIESYRRNITVLKLMFRSKLFLNKTEACYLQFKPRKISSQMLEKKIQRSNHPVLPVNFLKQSLASILHSSDKKENLNNVDSTKYILVWRMIKCKDSMQYSKLTSIFQNFVLKKLFYLCAI